MRRRGYSLPLVLLVLTTLGLAITSLTTVLADSARTTGSLAGRRRTLYACDGVTRALALTAGEYFKSAPNPTTEELRQAICGTTVGPACPTASTWLPDYTLDSVEVTTGAVNVLREIPSGPFAGQTSRRTDLALTVAMTHDTGRACRVTQRMINGQIGLFQFAVFSGVPIDLFNPAPMTLSGRTHINGDFCAGGSGRGLTIERLTVSGEIHSGCFGGSRALRPRGNISTDGFFAIDKDSGDPVLLSSANDRSRGDAWRALALATWNGNVLDSAHDVPQLRLPVTTATQAQPGINQDLQRRTNLETFRVMVDPPQPGDSGETAAERLFNKADIRIINGVWYRRDGTVMWSDHTGAHISAAEEQSLGAVSNVPASTAGPELYSYYERTSSGTIQFDSSPSVVSYGTLFPAGPDQWVPGYPESPEVVGNANDARKLIAGTRTGFVDRRLAQEEDSSGMATSQPGERGARILPLNFDVRAFTTAMTTTTSGELGSYFEGGARFNGIVWIGNSWPNHDRGFTSDPGSSTMAATAPDFGLVDQAQYQNPPLPLCRSTSSISSDLVAAAGGLPAVPQVGCGDSALPRVNAVRIINARTINPNVFPRGLTIASNGPVYTLGDVNSDSLTAAGAPRTPRMDSPSGQWVPVMLAGDALTVLSNNWRDRAATAPDRTWGENPVELRNDCTADATPTTLAVAVVAGHVDTASTWGGGINNFPRFIECWNDQQHRLVGSLVIGFRSVYQRHRYHLYSYRPPDRAWGFDENLASPARQPPGTPMFFVQAIERWQRD